jgi:hypothetical protein
MRRLRNEDPSLTPQPTAALAAYAHNHAHKRRGFSPIQWAHGYDPDSKDNAHDPFW